MYHGAYQLWAQLMPIVQSCTQTVYDSFSFSLQQAQEGHGHCQAAVREDPQDPQDASLIFPEAPQLHPSETLPRAGLVPRPGWGGSCARRQ